MVRKPSKVNNMSIKGYSEVDVTNLLLRIAKDKRLAENYVNRFRSNRQLAPVFNIEDVSGELKSTLVQVLNAWKTYQVSNGVRKVKIKKELKIKLSKKLKLDTVSHIEGYFINAFKNNMSKIYTKYKTEKRAACRQTIGFDDPKMEKHEKHALESAIAVEPMKDLEFDTTMRQIGDYLAQEDLKKNLLLAADFGSLDAIPSKDRYDLAGLWMALQDPSIKKEMDKVRLRFGWTEHVFKRNRELMEDLVRNKFLDEGRELLSYVVEKNSAAYFNKEAPDKKQKEMKAEQAPILEVHSVFYMTTDKRKKKKYGVTISLDQYKEGSWVPLTKKVKTLDYDKAKNFDEAKAKLKESSKKEFEIIQTKLKQMRQD